jgi:hypothetical protein
MYTEQLAQGRGAGRRRCLCEPTASSLRECLQVFWIAAEELLGCWQCLLFAAESQPFLDEELAPF